MYVRLFGRNQKLFAIICFQLIIFDHEEGYVTDCKSDNSAGRQKKSRMNIRVMKKKEILFVT